MPTALAHERPEELGVAEPSPHGLRLSQAEDANERGVGSVGVRLLVLVEAGIKA